MKVLPITEFERIARYYHECPYFFDDVLSEACITINDWITIEEFQKNPINGTYWIYYDNNVIMAEHLNDQFYFDDFKYSYDKITHVMLIDNPESP